MTEKTLKLENTPFIREIKDDLKNKHKGRFMVVTGGIGDGKSMMAARLGELVDSDFNVDHIAIAKTTIFINLLRKALSGEYKHGSCIILDEGGCGMGSREWNTAQNRLLSLIFQVIRKLGLLIIITVPSKAMIDISAQRLMKNYANAIGVDYEKKRSLFKIFNIRYNDWDDTFRRYYLKDENNEKITLWELALPEHLDIKEYEKRKDEAIGWLFDRADRIFNEIEGDYNGCGSKIPKGYISKEEVIKNAKMLGISLEREQIEKLLNVRERQARYLVAAAAKACNI